MTYADFFRRELKKRPYAVPLLTGWKNAAHDKSALYKVLFALLIFPAAFPLLSIINIIAGPLIVGLSLFELLRALLFQGLVLVALLLYVVLAFRESKYKPFLTRTHLYLFGLGMLLLAAAAFSQDLRASIFSSSARGDGLLFLLHIGIYVLMLSWIVRERRELELAFIMIVALGAASTVGVFLVHFWQSQNNSGVSISNSIQIILGNLGFFAHYLMLIFFTNLYFIIFRPRIWNIAVLTAVTIVLFFTSSSTALGLVAIVWGILVFKIARPWFYGFLGFGLFAWWYGITFGDAFLARLANPITEEFVRGAIWTDAIQLVAKYKPFLGFGWGNAEIMWNFLEHDSWAASGTPWQPLYFDRTHNIALEFFAAGGILGLAALTLFWTRIMRRAIRLTRDGDKAGLFLTAAFGAQFLYLQFNFDTVMSYILVSIWLAAFLIFTQEQAVILPHISIPLKFKWVGTAVLCVFILSMLWYLNLRPLSVFFQATQVQGDAGRVPTTPRGLDVKRAQFERAPERVGLNRSILNEVGMAFQTIAAGTELPEEQLADYIRAMRVNSDALIAAHPQNPFYYFRRARGEYEIAKDFNQSADYLKQAIALAPAKGIFRFQLGIIYLRDDKISEARDIFLELKRRNWNAGAMDLYLAVADFLEGNLQAGRKKFLSSLGSYVPTTGVEWHMLTGAYLVHGKPADLLAWYERIYKLVGSNGSLDEIMRTLESML
ncbi:O-antigen ligase family protein [Candidatus Uhrbacteria bacterium]|nr:O-antigen ligase family protein [Candidatus Uhrbacteria bacterium]